LAKVRQSPEDYGAQADTDGLGDHSAGPVRRLRAESIARWLRRQYIERRPRIDPNSLPTQGAYWQVDTLSWCAAFGADP
jgi:hypothetical protein